MCFLKSTTTTHERVNYSRKATRRLHGHCMGWYVYLGPPTYLRKGYEVAWTPTNQCFSKHYVFGSDYILFRQVNIRLYVHPSLCKSPRVKQRFPSCWSLDTGFSINTTPEGYGILQELECQRLSTHRVMELLCDEIQAESFVATIALEFQPCKLSSK